MGASLRETAVELNPQQEAELAFLLALLKDSFGGVPAAGVVPAEGVEEGCRYVFFETCSCQECKVFSRVYPPMFADNMLTAAKLYGDARICFNQTKEMLSAGERKH